jgi:hypothetical protein
MVRDGKVMDEIAVKLINLQTEDRAFASAIRIENSGRHPPIRKLTLPGRLYRIQLIDIYPEIRTYIVGTVQMNIDFGILFVLQGDITAYRIAGEWIQFETLEMLRMNCRTTQNYPQDDLEQKFFNNALPTGCARLARD